MKNNKVVLTIFGAVLAALWTGQAAAGMVLLTKTNLDPNVLGGGGRTEFTIKQYQGFDDGLPLGAIDSKIYATCIEPNEFIGGNGDTMWYEIAALSTAPTSTGTSYAGQTISGFSTDEVDIVERVVSEKFGIDLAPKSGLDSDVAALQALLWHLSVSDWNSDFTQHGPAKDTQAYNDAASTAGGWIESAKPGAANRWADSVSSYALLARKNQAGQSVNRQDFVTFLPGSSTTTKVPVPAPLLLFATGLLGLYGALRRRRA